MEIDGRALRRVLVMWLLEAEGALTVGHLVFRLEEAGLGVRGRAGKVVSDSLRWEVRRGRVLRVRRSTYVIGRMPRSTAWWIRQQGRSILARGAARPGDRDELTRTAMQALEQLAGARAPREQHAPHASNLIATSDNSARPLVACRYQLGRGRRRSYPTVCPCRGHITRAIA